MAKKIAASGEGFREFMHTSCTCKIPILDFTMSTPILNICLLFH